MASQLIYTSAPRLLEAGRTGFGTVARHRAVSGLLVAAVERVSQFARLPSLSPRRVVLSHRLIHAGASTYHVLSCIRDAGSDYTGRTNHLAHHLIVDQREVRIAAEAGLTPADVLRQMSWRTAWSESPRFFDPAEEIALTRFRPGIASSDQALAAAVTWKKLTGQASHAWLPAQAQRCLLLLPGEDSSLPLFQESLQLMGATAAWQVSFATHVEPTDDLAALRWIALSHSSAQRPQVESAARVTFDLTQPQSLPEPKITEPKASSLSIPTAAPAVSPPRSAPTQAVAATPLPPLFEERRAPAKRAAWPVVAAALVIAAAGIAAFVFLLPATRPSPAVAAIQVTKTVDDLWLKHRLILPTTQNWLKAQASEALLDSHAKALEQIAAALREPLRPLEIPRPESTQDEFMDMILHFSQWQRELHQAMRDEAWSGDDPQLIQAQALVTEGRLKKHWSQYAIAFSSKPVMPELLTQHIHQQVLKHLSGSSAPRQSSAESWLELLNRTRSSNTLPLSWLQHWPLAEQKAEQWTDAQREQLREAAALADAPIWFRDQIQKKLSAPVIATTRPMATPTEREESAVAKPALTVISADGPASPHARYVIVESPILPVTKALEAMPTLPTEADMELWVGSPGVSESKLTRWKQLGAGGVYRRSFNDSNTLEFRMHRLVRLPTEPNGLRVIARTADGAQVLFEIILIPADAPIIDAWPITATFRFQSRREGQNTVLDAEANRWLQSILLPGGGALRLQQVDDVTQRFRLRSERGQIVLSADTSASGAPEVNATKLNALDVEIESVSQSLKLDEQRRTELAEGNLAQQQKESALERLDTSLKTRQLRLSSLQKERQALSPNTARKTSLPSGTYSLFAGLRRLCEIQIQGTP